MDTWSRKDSLGPKGALLRTSHSLAFTEDGPRRANDPASGNLGILGASEQHTPNSKSHTLDSSAPLSQSSLTAFGQTGSPRVFLVVGVNVSLPWVMGCLCVSFQSASLVSAAFPVQTHSQFRPWEGRNFSLVLSRLPHPCSVPRSQQVLPLDRW